MTSNFVARYSGVFAWVIAALTLASSAASAQSPRILLNAVPGDGHVFLAWTSDAPLRFPRVAWRSRAGSWTEVALRGVRSTAAIDRLANDSAYYFRVEAIDPSGRLLQSPMVSAIPHVREDCGAGDFVYCVPGLRERITELGFSGADLTCNGARVELTVLDIPDCMFVGPGVRVVLNRQFHSLELAKISALADRRLVQSAARFIVAGDTAWPFRRSRIPVHVVTPRGRVAVSETFETEADSATAFDVLVMASVRSRGTWYVPAQKPTKGVAIYIEGHGLQGAADEGFGGELTARMLAQGWEVVTMDMLLEGANIVDQTGFVATHDDMAANFKSDTLFRMHFEPIRSIVDSIARRGQQQLPVVVLGRSGGGWLASLYALLDPRVAAYVTVAGGQPQSYMSVNRDFEFYFGKLFSPIPYDQILGASGECGAVYFASALDPTDNAIAVNSPLAQFIREAFARRGAGYFRLTLDPTHPEHSLSAMGFAAVDNLLSAMATTAGCTTARAR